MRKKFILPGRNEMKNGTNYEADNTKTHERDVPDDGMLAVGSNTSVKNRKRRLGLLNLK